MPAKQPAAQFDFLSAYIEKVLAESGLENLTEESKKAYVPRIAAEAERRIGLALTPRLSENAAKEFSQLLNDKNLDVVKLESFWRKNVPDFDQVVAETLKNFAVEVKSIIAS